MGVYFILGGRRLVGQAGQDLTHAAHAVVHMPCRFEDPAVAVRLAQRLLAFVQCKS